jgi:hypothetical protein
MQYLFWKKKKKKRQFNLDPFILFVDCVKALNGVLRGKLWSIMAEERNPEHLIQGTKSLNDARLLTLTSEH